MDAAAAPGIVLDGTMGPAGAIPADLGAYDITSDLGQVRGGNLFQSFSRFGLQLGETALFTGPSSVHNVLVRIDGGVASNIDGSVRCTIPNADFFLLNSSGVMFGPNVQFDVKGALVVSTADTLRFVDGGHLGVTTPSNSVLSSADPVGFGFSSTTPAGVSFQGVGTKLSTLSVADGNSLSIVSGPITLTSGRLVAPEGRVNLVAVGAPQDVQMNVGDLHTPISFSADAARGDIKLSASQVNVDGPGGGAVVVRGANIELQNSTVSAATSGSLAGAGIDIGASGEVGLIGSMVQTTTTGTGAAGPVTINAQILTLDARGLVNKTGSPFQSLDVGINTSFVLSTNTNSGTSGAIRINAATLQVFDNPSLSDLGIELAGGSVTVSAPTITLDGTPARISVDPTKGGAQVLARGQVTIDSTLGSSAQTLTGPVYDITASAGVRAGSNLFESFSAFSIGIGEQAIFESPAGVTTVIARVTGNMPSNIQGTLLTAGPDTSLYLINPAGVSFGLGGPILNTPTGSNRQGASLNLTGSFAVSTADQIQLSDGGRFDASNPTFSSLTGGSPTAFNFTSSSPKAVQVLGTPGTQIQQSQLCALAVGAGQSLSIVGGPVRIDAGSLSAPGGRINIVGAAGGTLVPIAAGLDADLTVGSSRSDISIADSSNLNANGNGGRVSLRGANINLQDSTISATTEGANASRGVDIDASSEFTLLRSSIAAGTNSSGAGGSVNVAAPTVVFDGRGTSNTGSFAQYAVSADSQASIAADMSVEVDLTDSGLGNLALSLISPAGTAVSLLNEGLDLVGTVFNDRGLSSLNFQGPAPSTGIFKPAEPLANLIGQTASGLWQLRVVNSNSVAGALNHWALTIGKNPTLSSTDTPLLVPGVTQYQNTQGLIPTPVPTTTLSAITVPQPGLTVPSAPAPGAPGNIHIQAQSIQVFDGASFSAAQGTTVKAGLVQLTAPDIRLDGRPARVSEGANGAVAIAPLAQVVLDGTLGTSGTLVGPNYVIPETDGKVVGANLFHSFSEFDLNTNEIATFTGDNSIQNVLVRVTGQNGSHIDGRLICDIPKANLFLISPAGVALGADAQFVLSGALTVTTAGSVRLSDGGRFDAETPGGSLLTAGTPVAFDFPTATIGPISYSGALAAGNLFTVASSPPQLDGGLAPAGTNIQFIGGALQFSGGITGGSAPFGQVALVAAASPGEVAIGAPAASQAVDAHTISAFADVQYSGPTNEDFILTEQAPLLASSLAVWARNLQLSRTSAQAGSVSIHTDTLQLTESTLTVNSSADLETIGDISMLGSSISGPGAVTVRAGGTVSLVASSIHAIGGAVSVAASNLLHLAPDSSITSTAGPIAVDAGRLLLDRNGSGTASISSSDGDITVSTSDASSAAYLPTQIFSTGSNVGSASSSTTSSAPPSIGPPGLVRLEVNGQPSGVAGAVSYDNSMGPAGPLPGPDYLAASGRGDLIGANLFESFSQLDVAQQERLTFSAPAGVENVLVRVTGGAATIDGLVRVSSPRPVRLYLIDPSGIAFGAGADINLSGSFLATTGSYVRLGSIGRFDAMGIPTGLIADEPTAIGFGASAAPISISGTPGLIPSQSLFQQSSPSVASGARQPASLVVSQSLSLVGGSIQIQTADAIAPIMSFAACGLPVEIPLNAADHISIASAAPAITAGDLSIGDFNADVKSYITSSGTLLAASGMVLRGHSLTLNQSNLQVPADVHLSGDAMLLGTTASNLALMASNVTIDSGTAGPATINCQNLIIKDDATLAGGTFNVAGMLSISGDGAIAAPGGGIVRMNVGSLVLDTGLISSVADSNGTAGPITVAAGQAVALQNGGRIFSQTGDTAGSDITIHSPFVNLDSSGIGAALIYSRTIGTGKAGNVEINGGSLQVAGASSLQIFSTSGGTGAPGQVSLGGASSRGGSVVLDGSLGQLQPLNGPNFVIPASAGLQINGNLFESFRIFTLDHSQSATFAAPASVQNVLVRVTGGSAADIDGRINAPNVNLFLMDPAGIVFGPNASLNIGKSLAVTTASSISLGSSGQFAATQSEDGTLTGAAPAAFGFASSTVGKICIFGYQPDALQSVGEPGLSNSESASAIANALSMAPATALSFITGDVQVVGRLLNVPGGRVNLIAVNSPGSVTFDATDKRAGVVLSGFSQLGHVELTGGARLDVSDLLPPSSSLDTSVTGLILNAISGGTIVVRSDSLAVHESQLLASTTVPSVGPTIDMTLSGNVDLRNATLLTSPIFVGDGQPVGMPGDIQLLAANLQLASSSLSTADNTVNAGSLTVRALNQITLSASQLAVGSGTADLSAAAITFDSQSSLAATVVQFIRGREGGSAAGVIRITADDLRLMGGSTIAASGQFSSTGGNIELNVGALSLSQASQVDSSAQIGTGGAIVINASGAVSLAGAGTGISDEATASTFRAFGGDVALAGGTGGEIDITSATLSLKDGAHISASGLGGTGGNIKLTAGGVTLSNLSTLISADTSDDLLFETGPVRPVFFPGGKGGDIQINAGHLSLTNGAAISAVTNGSGQAGNVTINGDHLALSGGSSIITTSFGSGAAGGIIASATTISGANSRIGSDALSTGSAGSVTLTAMGPISFTDASDVSTTANQAAGGNISISSQASIALSGASTVSANALQAGSINVAAPLIAIQDGSAISTDTVAQPMQSSNITLRGSTILLVDSSIDARTVGSGSGGAIDINSAEFVMRGSAVNASSTGSGDAGDVTVNASDRIGLLRGADITTESSNSKGGQITLVAGQKIELQHATMSAQASSSPGSSGPGSGGNLILRSAGIIDLFHSKLLTGSVGPGGNIFLDPETVVLQGTLIDSHSTDANGGNVTIQPTGLLQSFGSQIKHSGKRGLAAGRLLLTPPNAELAGALVPLPANLQQGYLQLAPVCAPHLEGNFSSFVVTGQGGRPPEPGGWIPDLILPGNGTVDDDQRRRPQR